ncbi:hypothetical protein AAKU61_004085 [Undibacterium sp. GrIS 1.2]
MKKLPLRFNLNFKIGRALFFSSFSEFQKQLKIEFNKD